MATVNPGHGRARPAMNAEAHTWKACWGQPLASSNLASSAALTCKNTQDEHRQDCLDVEICLSFVSVPGHGRLCLLLPCDWDLVAARHVRAHQCGRCASSGPRFTPQVVCRPAAC